MSASVPPKSSDSQPSSQQIAESIERDFRVLIDSLDRHIQLLSGSNSEVLSHLARAKSVAERGLRLGERLSNRAIQGDTQSHD